VSEQNSSSSAGLHEALQHRARTGQKPEDRHGIRARRTIGGLVSVEIVLYWCRSEVKNVGFVPGLRGSWIGVALSFRV
jgi:hypothetical protein